MSSALGRKVDLGPGRRLCLVLVFVLLSGSWHQLVRAQFPIQQAPGYPVGSGQYPYQQQNHPYVTPGAANVAPWAGGVSSRPGYTYLMPAQPASQPVMGGAMMSQPAMQVPTLPQAGVAYPSYPSYSGMPQGLPVQPQMSANPYTGGGVSGVPVSVLPSQAVGSGVVESYSVVDRMLALAAKQEREGQPWQAIHTYRQALQLEPHNRSALLSYARMKHRAGDFDGAIILYGQILRYHALDPVALNDLGLCFARKGDLAQALDSLQKATQQRPDDKRYRNNLAIVLVESGRNQEALDQMQIAHGPAIANYNLAALLLRRGQAAEARQCLESAILHDPSFQPAMELLASLDDAPPSERIASREMGIPGGGLKGSPTRSSSKPPLGSNDAIEQPILIAPQSAELPEKLSTSVLQPAVWQEPAKAMPPSVEDYQISGLSEFE